ncbi:MAG: putative capsid protein [Cressdnaviricota sp.]|nr:MAG: putative capsid protein [Cressdnaviricota sp.]
MLYMAAGKIFRHRARAARRSRAATKPNRSYKGYQMSKWNPGISLCPDKFFTKLKYSETLEYPQLSAIADNIFRGNCHLDCNYTSSGPGKNAWGYQWHVFYNAAYVTSSKITCTVLNSGPIDGNVVQVTLFPSNTAIPTTVSQEANMHARRRAVLVNGTSDSKRLTGRYSTKSIIGNNRESSWNYSAQVPLLAQPAGNTYWHIVTELISGASGPMVIMVDIEYNVVFFDRRQELGTLVGPGEPV